MIKFSCNLDDDDDADADDDDDDNYVDDFDNDGLRRKKRHVSHPYIERY